MTSLFNPEILRLSMLAPIEIGMRPEFRGKRVLVTGGIKGIARVGPDTEASSNLSAGPCVLVKICHQRRDRVDVKFAKARSVR